MLLFCKQGIVRLNEVEIYEVLLKSRRSKEEVIEAMQPGKKLSVVFQENGKKVRRTGIIAQSNVSDTCIPTTVYDNVEA